MAENLIIVGAAQIACTDEVDVNIAKIEGMVRLAVERGARLVVLQELFETPYFCKDELEKYKAIARPVQDHPTLKRLCELAKSTNTVLPFSFYERDGDKLYNSLCMIDADGSVLGLYRKSHIPEATGYTEKFYFSDGDTGFKVFDTKVGRIGAGICWDQWFPEAARIMVLQGAEILIYPTAIGSDPADRATDMRDHWQRVMQGHAGANVVPVIAANRVGTESAGGNEITFFGSSFITNHEGAKIAEADRVAETVITASLDLDVGKVARRDWGYFRDRRPDLYRQLLEPSPAFLLRQAH